MNNYIKKLAEENSRIDQRAFDEFREIDIQTDVSKNAEGSARVKIGNTNVIAGVKLSIMDPFPDTPDEGILIVGAELSPIASSEFETGPPGEESIELARVVDRGIRESKCIDVEKLCIKPGEKVWGINIDIQVLDHDGNLIDASALASVAALLSAKLPDFDPETYELTENYTGTLPITDIPVSVTTNKIKDKLLLDTSLEEETAADARITIATTKNRDICAIQKGGTGYFTTEEIRQAVELSLENGEKIRKLLKV